MDLVEKKFKAALNSSLRFEKHFFIHKNYITKIVR